MGGFNRWVLARGRIWQQSIAVVCCITAHWIDCARPIQKWEYFPWIVWTMEHNFLYIVVFYKDSFYEKSTSCYPKFQRIWYTAQTMSATNLCLLLYLSTFSQPTGFFISAHVSELWLFSLCCFHVCLLISKWWTLRSKEFALNFASSSTKLQLKPTESSRRPLVRKL